MSTPERRFACDLPNFPNEIIQSWLSTYLQSEGWPPKIGIDGIPTDRWRYLLARRSLHYWRQIDWRLENRTLHESELDAKSLGTVQSLIAAYIHGETNIYSAEIGDGQQRFAQLARFTLANGSMPVPPVLIEEPTGLTIMDGNHRITALFVCRQLSIYDPEKVRANGVFPQSDHAVWVGYDALTPNNALDRSGPRE
jgi:hypothetical protein